MANCDWLEPTTTIRPSGPTADPKASSSLEPVNENTKLLLPKFKSSEPFWLTR